MKFDRVIQILTAARNDAIALLRADDKSAQEKRVILDTKLELDKAIGCLRLCGKYEIEPEASVITLPEKSTKTILSEYRVVEDCETDERTRWIEVEVAGHRVRPIPGALIIERTRKGSV